jgi:hypothetical protein
MGARLEGDEHRRPRRVVPALACVGDRRHLGVCSAELSVPPLAENLAAAGDDRADERIRADAAAAPLGQLQRAAQMRLLVLAPYVRRVHRLTD